MNGNYEKLKPLVSSKKRSFELESCLPNIGFRDENSGPPADRPVVLGDSILLREVRDGDVQPAEF
jgi:hypothetical protein